MDDARLDDLYAAPIDRFVATRNALAKELKADGEAEAAAEVAALRKPTLVAWALNQLVRAHPDTVDRLLEVQVGMQDASSAADLRAAAEERQRLVGELADEAVRTLEQAGHAGESARDRISLSLLSTGTDSEAAESLRAGRLTREVEPVSTWDLGLLPPGQPVAPEGDDGPAHRRELEAARTELRRREERAELLDRQAEEAARRLERARAAAEEAAAEAAKAHAAVASQSEVVQGLAAGGG